MHSEIKQLFRASLYAVSQQNILRYYYRHNTSSTSEIGYIEFTFGSVRFHAYTINQIRDASFDRACNPSS